MVEKVNYNSAVSSKEIQRLDHLAIHKYRIPSLALMENAGRAVAFEVIKEKKKKICILCGPGNNGGDGFVAARHLIFHGINPEIVLIGKTGQLKDDPLFFYHFLEKMKVGVRESAVCDRSIFRAIKRSDIVVDAIFGVGLNRIITEPYKKFVNSINKYSQKTISVDVPSGLDGTTGKIYGVCVKADKTIAFTFAKKGFFVNEGPKVSGKIIVADIGIPDFIKQKILKK